MIDYAHLELHAFPDEPTPSHSMSRVLVLLGAAVALYLVVKWK